MAVLSDLELIIDHYQWEVQRLNMVLAEQLDQVDYAAAEFTQAALFFAKNELDKFQLLKNPLHYEVALRQRYLEGMERRKSNGSGIALQMEGYYKEKVKQLKRELKELETLKPPFKEDTQYIDEALYKLVAGQVTGFRLLLIKKKQLHLYVSLNNKDQIILAFRSIDKLGSYQQENLIRSRVLKKMGFALDRTMKNLSLLIGVHDPKNLYSIKMIISRLLIDLRDDIRLDNPIHLEFC